jgi:hypothetical protein
MGPNGLTWLLVPVMVASSWKSGPPPLGLGGLGGGTRALTSRLPRIVSPRRTAAIPKLVAIPSDAAR